MKGRTKKVPLGVMPRKLWEEDRQLNLLTAMCRYVEAYIKIPPEWIDELNELNRRAEFNDSIK